MCCNTLFGMSKNTQPLRRESRRETDVYSTVLVLACLTIRLVEITGIEPVTSGLQSRRSPN
jgi:hypothetical protein